MTDLESLHALKLETGDLIVWVDYLCIYVGKTWTEPNRNHDSYPRHWLLRCDGRIMQLMGDARSGKLIARLRSTL